MKRLIFTVSDANIAGFSWRWDFYVQRWAKRWRVSALQVVHEDESMRLTPRLGLVDGAQIHRALCELAAEAGYHELSDQGLARAATILDGLDPVAGEAFRHAEAMLEARAAAAAESAAAELTRRLAPYRDVIDDYVQRFIDTRLRHGGPSARFWARRFIEEYVLRKGCLPTGEHQIQIDGYSGSRHDFTDLPSQSGGPRAAC